MVAVVQIGQQGPDPRTERCSRLHSDWRIGAIAPTTPAATTEKLHPGHDRLDRREIDMVVTMPAALGLTRHIGPAMTAGIGHDALGLVRRIRQRPRLPLARRTLACRRLAPPPGPAKPVLRRRNMRIARRLAWLADQALKLGYPRHKPLDHLLLLNQQGVLLSIVQAKSRRRWHPQDESNPSASRNTFLPTR